LLILIYFLGPFSHLDNENWTHSLKEALNYDQLGALQNDDGNKLNIYKYYNNIFFLLIHKIIYINKYLIIKFRYFLD